MIVAEGFTWSPPAEMTKPAISAWVAFYRDSWDKYQVTPKIYRALYLAQSGRCYICRTARGKHPDDPKARGGRRLGIDHNHALGDRIEAVRGLLCTGGDRTCNRIIGWLPPDALARAVQYVNAPPAQVVLRALEQGARDVDLLHLVTA